MRRTDFLIKIRKEEKLDIVEPNEEVKEAYIKKSESYLASAKILLKNKRLEESVSMAYYSMYYILTALLFKTGIKSENHSTSIILLKELFDINNKNIYYAKKERIDKQYYVDFQITENEVKDLIEKAELFYKELYDFISKLNNESIQKYREKLRKIFAEE